MDDARSVAYLPKLAEAARRLGRDIDTQPLAVDGPQEVRLVAGEFNAMQSRIKELINQRTEMLAAVSHDLRTYLTRLELDLTRLLDDLAADHRDADESVALMSHEPVSIGGQPIH